MRAGLKVIRVGALATLQDFGRPHAMALGLSRGGAMDTLALHEAAALLGEPVLPALELAGGGYAFEAQEAPVAVALTGAELVADIDGRRAAWNALHIVNPGEVLTLGASLGGSYSYVSVCNGFDGPEAFGSASARPDWGLGQRLAVGDVLTPRGVTKTVPRRIPRPWDRQANGPVRFVAGPQTDLFPDDVQRAFEQSSYRQSGRANRVGVALGEGPALRADAHLSLVSDVVVPGDIQAVGAGQPFVLFADCQTTGGYPRIGTVISADLPRLVQMGAGREISFRRVSLEAALAARQDVRAYVDSLAGQIQPLLRDPQDIGDLLALNLVSGAVSGHEED